MASNLELLGQRAAQEVQAQVQAHTVLHCTAVLLPSSCRLPALPGTPRPVVCTRSISWRLLSLERLLQDPRGPLSPTRELEAKRSPTLLGLHSKGPGQTARADFLLSENIKNYPGSCAVLEEGAQGDSWVSILGDLQSIFGMLWVHQSCQPAEVTSLPSFPIIANTCSGWPPIHTARENLQHFAFSQPEHWQNPDK